jgi:hypothetical protein
MQTKLPHIAYHNEGLVVERVVVGKDAKPSITLFSDAKSKEDVINCDGLTADEILDTLLLRHSKITQA